ncbi:11959_t:CDS:1 [Diversispora eburnea]|uniref:11959_t:CDS:1 n=1 Tax=Diversispora eburnea TaxID=1213867 RepID=A0A9N8YZ94_9GLOM|nr:11959_t:CDS:1 [Diversispora eburnea]
MYEIKEEKGSYHHYIPRFILRNFAIDNYDRVFVNNKKIFNQNKKFWKKRREELLQTYDRIVDELEFSLISKTYGCKNMYKDFNHEDAENVEKKLAKLEGQSSKVIRDIIEVSEREIHITLLRKDLEDLRKFLFIMNYRNPYRRIQYTDKIFDPITWSMVKNFMKGRNLQSPLKVWLQNVREILETPHEDVKDNPRIFGLDRSDYRTRMIDCFLAIWKAGENDEFLVTSNSFGIFEGINFEIHKDIGSFKFAFHWFYVISPKIMLVLCHSAFRKENGFEYLYKFLGFKYHSIFENVPHLPATVKYVGRIDSSRAGLKPDNAFDNSFDRYINSIGLETQPDDKFTFPFVKVNSATVHLVNAIILNEARSDLIISYVSPSYLYKTIVKYHKNPRFIKQNFSSLKKKLFTELNKTHKEDLNFRKNIPTRGRTRIWHECRMVTKS